MVLLSAAAVIVNKTQRCTLCALWAERGYCTPKGFGLSPSLQSELPEEEYPSLFLDDLYKPHS